MFYLYYSNILIFISCFINSMKNNIDDLEDYDDSDYEDEELKELDFND